MGNIDIKNFFLIRDVKEDYIEHVNNEISIGFRLEHHPYGITSSETQANTFKYLNKLIRGWPAGTWIQKQDFYYERRVTPNAEKVYSDISRENYKYYSMRDTLGHASFIYITYLSTPFRNYRIENSPFVRMVEQAFTLKDKKHKEQSIAFIKATKQELETGTNGFKGTHMSPKDWEKVFYAYYSGDYNFDNDHVPDVLDLGTFQLTREGYLQRENTLFSNVFLGKEPMEAVKLSDQFKIISHTKRDSFAYNPNQELVNYAAFPINGGIPFTHCTTVTIQKAESQKVINEINRQMDLNIFTIDSGGGKNNPDNINAEEKETQKAHATNLKRYITNSPYPACTYGVTVSIPSHDISSLSEKTEMAKSAFSQYGAKGDFNRAHNMPSFFSAAPAHGHNGHDFLIGQSVNALPFVNINSYSEGDKSGILYIDPTTGSPINFEPWYNPLLAGIRNGVYVGPSRGGKSVIVSNECDYYFHNGFHQVIMEKGRSYEWLCAIYGGDYIILAPDAKVGIDLFDYDPVTFSELQKDIMVSVLSKMYPKVDENVVAGVRHMIESYTKEIRLTKAKPSIENFYNYYTDVYMKSNSVYAKHMDLALYQVELERFVHGEIKWLFNNENNVKINHTPLVVFELKELEKSPLFGIAAEAILGLINRKMEFWDREIKLVITIDEALQAFESKHSAKNLKELYTQAGKFNTGIRIMIQNITLIDDSPAWEAVKSNSPLTVVTYNAHTDGWAESVAKSLNWSNHRYSLAKNLRNTDRFRELLMIVGEQEKVVGLSLSPIANYAFSTEAEERKEIQKIKEENPGRNLRELIFEHYYLHQKP